MIGNPRERYPSLFPKSTSAAKRDMPHIWAGTGNAEILSVRILIVDHDVRVREILVQRLRGRGHDADGAQGAAEAFDLLSSAIYDIILLDVVMPRNASLEVMTLMRGLAFPPRCIVMSGVANLWRRANPDVPVAGVLQKPFAFEELLRLIA